ncbi:MAG: hypothetical protein ACRDIY_16950 [Chloroflexota bacterium]
MFGLSPQDVINFQPDKQFVDLTDLPSIKNFEQVNANRFVSWKGKVWIMTMAYVGLIVWANEDLLAKYSLQHPTTYAEFQKLGAFTGAFGDDPAANQVQPVYGDISWAGLNYSKGVDTIRDWIDFFGEKDNYRMFRQVLEYYPTQDVELTRPVPEAEAPLMKKTAVAMARLILPGMVYDHTWPELFSTNNYTPEAFARYVQQQFDDSRPQW